MPVLEITDLTKSYPSPGEGRERAVLDIASFSLEAGEQMALEGESGSGKTTFLNIIAGILQPTAGRVMVAGADMGRLSEGARDRHRGRHIGYVFQTFNLLQGCTALENVALAMAFGGGVDGARARQMLERVGLADRMDYSPAQLSVGQQQRVAVARALVNQPSLVLADEPTGNLDRARSRVALALIREICRESGAALLLVSHDPEVLGAFDRVEKLSELNRATAGDAEPLGAGVDL